MTSSVIRSPEAIDDRMAGYVLRFVFPAAFALLPAEMDSPAARVLMLTIGYQESRFTHRRQVNGPARGFYQFERGGGVTGVLGHPATMLHAAFACAELQYRPNVADCYTAIEHNDVLATVFARLLLWTLPDALPTQRQPDRAWRQYLKAWRPGVPRRESFDPFLDRAWTLIGETL